MKINMDYTPAAFWLNVVTTLMVLISMVGNWLAYYHRGELMQQISELRMQVNCFASATESERQKCIR